jgi:hypothetical protein
MWLLVAIRLMVVRLAAARLEWGFSRRPKGYSCNARAH